MELILGFISDYATEGIVLFGLVMVILLFWNGIKLSDERNRIKEALNRRNNIYTLNAASEEMEESEDPNAAITPDTIRKYETEFNKKCALHHILAQLIPVFPLLGILGTVAGLMLEIQSQSIEAMMGSLDVALSTTLFGLIFAIILKLIEAMFPSRVIYEVEVLLDDFDKKLSIAEMFQRFKEEK